MAGLRNVEQRHRPGSIARAGALLLAIPFLTFASALVPRHVHEPGPGHDHPVAHSHFEPHSAAAPRRNDDVTEIEHDVEHVVYVDSVFVHVTPVQIVLASSVVPVSYDPIPRLTRWTVIPSDDIAPAHGPPKRHVPLRGPPSLLV
jgi:hypothetical protein